MNNNIGIVFDLDGVITDTAKLHFKAWSQEGKKRGLILTKEQNDKLRGLNRQKTAKAIFDLNNRVPENEELEKFCEEKNSVYKEMLKTELDSSFILGGIDKTLIQLREKGFLLAVASSSHNAPTILKKLNLDSLFDVVVDPKTIVKHKPFPEMYLKAVEKLGVDPERSIGVEDAPAGAKGIIAAKMICVAVKWTTPASEFEGADYIVNTSSELTTDFFQKIVSTRIDKNA